MEKKLRVVDLSPSQFHPEMFKTDGISLSLLAHLKE